MKKLDFTKLYCSASGDCLFDEYDHNCKEYYDNYQLEGDDVFYETVWLHAEIGTVEQFKELLASDEYITVYVNHYRSGRKTLTVSYWLDNVCHNKTICLDESEWDTLYIPSMLAADVFNTLSDGYDDEEYRESTIEALEQELYSKHAGFNDPVAAAMRELVKRVRDLEN